MEGHDGFHGGGACIEWHDDGPVAHEPGQGLAALGPHHDVDTQTSGCGQEVRGSVGPSRQQQEDAGHSPRMVPSNEG